MQNSQNQIQTPSFEELAGIPKDAERPSFTGTWIPAQLYEDKELKAIHRDLYGQIASFRKGCWLKSTELEERLGVKTKAFQRACKLLRDRGYIDEKRQFGRIVRWSKLEFASSGSKRTCSSGPKRHQCQNEPVHQVQNEPVHQVQNEPVHIDKRKNIKEKTIKGADAPVDEKNETKESKQQYGNEQVNEFLDAWQEATGFDYHKNQRQRRAAWNLIKSNPPEALKPLLSAVKDAASGDDRFAPQIAAPSDLVGKYSKLNKLRMWVAKNQQPEEPLPGYISFDMPPPLPEVSDEERERVRQMFKEARKSGKLKFLKGESE